MSIDMVLNEISTMDPATDKYTAQATMSGFVRTILEAQKQNIRGAFRVHSNFYATLLAPDYSLAQWLVASDVNRDERLFLTRLVTSSPFLSDLHDMAREQMGYEFLLEGKVCEGLGVAYLLDAMTISLKLQPKWNKSVLSLTVQEMTEDAIVERTVEVPHISEVSHVAVHLEWITERLKRSITDGLDMWNRRQELFPSLVFCDAVREQISGLNRGTPMLPHITKRLFDLEMCGSAWKTGAFEPMKIPGRVSPESETTLKKFAKSRTFRCPDGQERIFEWHLKLGPDAWRIHFYFDNAKVGEILVGYVGPHLPTAHDPT